MTSTAKLTPVFQYDALAADTAVRLRDTACRIRARVKVTTTAIIEIGTELVAVKKELEHGRFTQWVETECGFSLRTAERFIGVAKFAAGKTDIVSNLQVATVYRIAAKSAPTKIVKHVLNRVEAGRPPSENEVVFMLDQARRRKQNNAGATPKVIANSLLAAWKAASERDRAELISLTAQQHSINSIWSASSDAARRQFVQDRRKEIEGLLPERALDPSEPADGMTSVAPVAVDSHTVQVAPCPAPAAPPTPTLLPVAPASKSAAIGASSDAAPVAGGSPPVQVAQCPAPASPLAPTRLPVAPGPMAVTGESSSDAESKFDPTLDGPGPLHGIPDFLRRVA